MEEERIELANNKDDLKNEEQADNVDEVKQTDNLISTQQTDSMPESKKTKGVARSKQTDDQACDVQGKKFKTKSGCKVQRQADAERSCFTCELCGWQFTRSYSLMRHQKKHENEAKKQTEKEKDEIKGGKSAENRVCEICEKQFKTKFGYERHKKIHDERFSYTCEICTLQFTRSDSYKRHMRKHESQGKESVKNRESKEKKKQVVVCKVCGQIFTSMNAFRIHKNKHLGIRYYCTRCAKSFTTTDQLKLHESNHDDVRNFHCSLCSAKFKRKQNLKRHIQQHEGTRRYTCHICGKGFVLSELLACHMRVHQNKPLLSCDICKATFKYEGSLKTHRKVHFNKMDFKCYICSREFLRKRTLEDHLKAHEKGSGRKALFKQPVEFCTLCSKGFTNTYGLKRHLRKHRMGMLKQHNLIHDVDDNTNSEMRDANINVRQFKESPQRRNAVTVHAQLKDNGKLYEKIDIECFMEKSSDLLIESKCEKEIHEDIHAGDALTLTSGFEEMKSDNGLRCNDETGINSNGIAMETNEIITDQASCLSFHETYDDLDNTEDNDDFNSSVNMGEDIDECNSTGNIVVDIDECNSTGNIEDIDDCNTTISMRVDTDQIEEVHSDIDLAMLHYLDVDGLSKGKDNTDSPNQNRMDRIIEETRIGVSGINDALEFEGLPTFQMAFKRADVAQINALDKPSDGETLLNKEKVADIDEDINLSLAETYDMSEDLSCKFCNKRKYFKNKNALMCHMKKMHMEKEKHGINNVSDMSQLDCKFCMTKYASVASLKMHLSRYHKNDDGKVYTCYQCQKMFASRILYKNHVDSHMIGGWKSKGEHKCDICNTLFKTLCTLRRHKRMRHGLEEDWQSFDPDNVDEELREDESEIEANGQMLHRESSQIEKENMEANSKQNQKGRTRGPESLKDRSFDKLLTDVKCQDVEDTVDFNIETTHTPDLQFHIVITDRNEIKDKINKDNKGLENKMTRINENNHTMTGEHTFENEKNGTKTLNTDTVKKTSSHTSSKARFQRKFQCVKCHKNFHLMSTLRRHMLGHTKHQTDKSELPCVQCDGKFRTKTQLIFHVHKFHSKFTLTCRNCPRKFTSVSCRRIHKCIKLKQSKSGDKSNMNMQKVRNTRNRKCKCIKSRNRASKQKEECEKCETLSQKKHKLNVKLHQCNNCDESFESNSRLKSHLKSVHKIFKYLCTKCPKRFASSSNLRRHETVNHSDSNDVLRNHMCSECGRCFTAKDSLRVHMFTHTGERPYKCSVCDASYIQSSHLIRHVKVVHEGKFKHKCQISGCGKSFYDLSVLRVHQRSHTDERPYPCPHCSQRFRTSTAKNTHIRTHLPIKQFECSICFQGLTTKHCLLKHLERHAAAEKMNPNSAFYDPNFNSKVRQKVVKKMEEKQFGCSFCSRTFTTTRGVYAHQRKFCEKAKDVKCENSSRYKLIQ